MFPILAFGVSPVDLALLVFLLPSLKITWVLVVLFTHFVGALICSFVGRKQGALPG